MKVWIVFQQPDDPYAGGPYIVKIFDNKEKAEAFAYEYNSTVKYDWDLYEIEEFEVE